jgi:hypothetical protein
MRKLKSYLIPKPEPTAISLKDENPLNFDLEPVTVDLVISQILPASTKRAL